MVDYQFFRDKPPRKRQRDLIHALFDSLAFNPFQEGDYQEIDEAQRTVEVKITGDYAVHYWADHPVRKVNVVKIIKADK